MGRKKKAATLKETTQFQRMERKKKADTLKETTQFQRTVNGSVTARNLRSDKLSGVILGCNYATIRECYTQLLFGLPAGHFSYIQHIKRGMPLFLFNYSDRKIHGIFEAASSGQMNINPHAWTTDASEITPFAAQVKVKVRKLCQPVVEELFKPIISENYYAEPTHFWFELDSGQTNKMVQLLLSSPASHAISRMLTPSTCQGNVKNEKPDSKLHYSSLPKKQGQAGCSNVGWGSEWNECGSEKNKETAKLDQATILPSKKWSSLFKDSSTHDTSDDNEDLKKESREVNLSYPEPCAEDEVVGITSHLEGGSQYEDWEDFVERLLGPELNGEKLSSNVDSEEDASVFETSDGENRATESSRDEDIMVNNNERHADLKLASECSFSTSEEACNIEVKSSIESAVAKLIHEFEELKAAQSTQTQKVNYLEQELIESKREVERLQNRWKILECASSHLPNAYSEETETDLHHKPYSRFRDCILLAGGFDGLSWMATLDSYSPSDDVVQSLCPMSLSRSFAASAKLNGELYILGGIDGSCNSYYDTVESYNPSSNKWVSLPSLNVKKGNLAGASLYDRIFAIGGGNGAVSFPDVEMFTPIVGRWIPICSMLHKRVAPAAAEINGMLYVVGGYDANEYLKSVERLDPRAHSWTNASSMNTRRGCHSLVVLNEKLYAIGGYDGTNMVPSMEILDPRYGSWTMAESMNDSRGYSGAVVIGQSIYVIGGLNNNGTILDTVEVYKEGIGWETIVSEAVGNRCYFSAIAF